jgi:hypothetical protein
VRLAKLALWQIAYAMRMALRSGKRVELKGIGSFRAVRSDGGSWRKDRRFVVGQRGSARVRWRESKLIRWPEKYQGCLRVLRPEGAPPPPEVVKRIERIRAKTLDNREGQTHTAVAV